MENQTMAIHFMHNNQCVAARHSSAPPNIGAHIRVLDLTVLPNTLYTYVVLDDRKQVGNTTLIAVNLLTSEVHENHI